MNKTGKLLDEKDYSIRKETSIRAIKSKRVLVDELIEDLETTWKKKKFAPSSLGVLILLREILESLNNAEIKLNAKKLKKALDKAGPKKYRVKPKLKI